MPDVEVTVKTTPIDVYINSDPTVYVNTATEGIQGPPLDSGIFVQRSETGLFYPNSNPSGFDSLPNATLPSQVVKWDGTQWIAEKISYSELSQQPAPSPGGLLPVGTSNGQILKWNNDPEYWYADYLNDKDLGGVVYTTGNQNISGLKSFRSGTNQGLLSGNYTLVTSPGNFILNNIISYGGYGNYGGYGYTTSPAIEFINNSSFNLYGSGQTAIKFYQKLITGFENINSRNFLANNNGYFGWFNPSLPLKSSRFTSKDGGGYWVTLDRADGSPENLNIAGNLQVGSGFGIAAQRLYVRGNALITSDLTVNTSGNFLSGLFVNRIPVLTGTSGTQSQINNLSLILNDSTIVRTTGNQTINANKTFVGDTKIWDGTSYGINIQTNGTFNLDGAEGNISLGDGIIQNFNDIFATNGHFGFLDGSTALYSIITGYRNIYQSGYRVIDESKTGIFATTGNLLDLNVKIDSVSGFFDLKIDNLSGYSEFAYATKNEINALSGVITGVYATKQYVIDSINAVSGNLSFVNYKYILTAGYDEYEVTFPQSFVQPPRTIMVQMENEEYNIIYAYDVYGITASGFSIKFSDILAETNNLMVLAKA